MSSLCVVTAFCILNCSHLSLQNLLRGVESRLLPGITYWDKHVYIGVFSCLLFLFCIPLDCIFILSATMLHEEVLSGISQPAGCSPVLWLCLYRALWKQTWCWGVEATLTRVGLLCTNTSSLLLPLCWAAWSANWAGRCSLSSGPW